MGRAGQQARKGSLLEARKEEGRVGDMPERRECRGGGLVKGLWSCGVCRPGGASAKSFIGTAWSSLGHHAPRIARSNARARATAALAVPEGGGVLSRQLLPLLPSSRRGRLSNLCLSPDARRGTPPGNWRLATGEAAACDSNMGVTCTLGGEQAK